MNNKSRLTRDRLIEALRKELMGPSTPDEVISGEFPTSRYIVGRLAPARGPDDDTDTDAAIDQSENDTLEVGVGDDETGDSDPAPPLIIGFSPSSCGLSFLIDKSVKALSAEVSWGDYRREKNEQGQQVWRRYQRDVRVENIIITKPGSLPQIPLATSLKNALGATVSGTDDREIMLEGVVHDFAGYRAVSLFIVNRRSKGLIGDRAKDERWIFQPRLLVSTTEGKPVFVAKDFASQARSADDDGESARNSLLYRHAREFATGHGVAAEWDVASEDSARATSISTEFMPRHEVPLLIAPSEHTGGATLDMKTLAEMATAKEAVHALEPMVSAYETWIASLEKASLAPEIKDDPQLRGAAKENISQCRNAAARMRAGLRLFERDPHILTAFRFANHAMWDQRVHSLWASQNRRAGEVIGVAASFDKPTNRTWRPFQMGFILLNLVGIADETSADRRAIDLLWFPTGGGKTEAYLGLAAFTIALRRLRGDRHGMCGGAGVSIIMRYTLRLLTVQQFQRGAALISACEVIRRGDVATWGAEPFRIGVWVGRNTTPNTFADSQSALEDIADGKRARSGSPVQLVSCPRCGTALVDDKGRPEKNTYQIDTISQRTLVWCPNEGCECSATASSNEGVPVVVVDEEIYRTCPSILVATVDKFARLPFQGQTRALFGLRDRYSPTYGHITEAHGEYVGAKKLRDAVNASRLLPPELVIQDELHLISGPLGTMVGLYETAVDYASSLAGERSARIPAKVIASTATIRRAAQQTHQLYGGRPLSIFPAPGLSARDSFFARELPIDLELDASAGRLYVGVNAPGSSTKTLLVRVYSILLAAAEAELQARSERC